MFHIILIIRSRRRREEEEEQVKASWVHLITDIFLRTLFQRRFSLAITSTTTTQLYLISLLHFLCLFVYLSLFHSSLIQKFRDMGCSQRHSRIIFSLLVFLISSSAQVRFMAEGRPIHKPMEAAQMGTDQEKSLIVRVSIGSRPPRCERVRCNSCTHCEAIQVPAIPQNKKSSSDKIRKDEQLSKVSTRGDDSSNYKPMSWKCKCGNLIFNP